jgi:hypothetical protein
MYRRNRTQLDYLKVTSRRSRLSRCDEPRESAPDSLCTAQVRAPGRPPGSPSRNWGTHGPTISFDSGARGARSLQRSAGQRDLTSLHDSRARAANSEVPYETADVCSNSLFAVFFSAGGLSVRRRPTRRRSSPQAPIPRCSATRLRSLPRSPPSPRVQARRRGR